MKATVWFRVSAVLFLLFAAGHTFGFLSFHGTTPEAQAVRASMDAVHFGDKPGTAGTMSFGGFYVGFGLFLSMAYLFLAWTAWRLGAMAKRGASSAEDVAALGWAMVLFMAVGVWLAFQYFKGPPVWFSVTTVITLALGTISARRQQQG